MEIQGHAVQLYMQRGDRGETNASRITLAPTKLGVCMAPAPCSPSSGGTVSSVWSLQQWWLLRFASVGQIELNRVPIAMVGVGEIGEKGLI